MSFIICWCLQQTCLSKS